ncbi:glucosaminidase domain-containing protein, partial [Alistipes ihumii]
MNPNRIVPLLIAAVLNVATLLGQQKLSREEYIRRYKGLAVEEMDIYGIPASIKMAQALLESDNGNGRLAREANNHFGIKCKSTWT